MRYKAGDKVVIINQRGKGWNLSGEMDIWQGKVMTISKKSVIIPWVLARYKMVEDGGIWAWDNRDIDDEATKNREREISMKAKEYLKNIEKIDRLIEEKLLQKDDLRNMKITASIDGMPRGNGGSSDKIGNAVAKIGEIEEEIDSKIDELIALKLEATGYINKLDVQENLLLDMRYIRGLEWKVIADEFCYEERNVHRLHSKALNKLDEIMERKNPSL